MVISRKDCEHTTLRFGSGDYYIFCADCDARWATVNPMRSEYGINNSSEWIGADPGIANIGRGVMLSGHERVKR